MATNTIDFKKSFFLFFLNKTHKFSQIKMKITKKMNSVFENARKFKNEAINEAFNMMRELKSKFFY